MRYQPSWAHVRISSNDLSVEWGPSSCDVGNAALITPFYPASDGRGLVLRGSSLVRRRDTNTATGHHAAPASTLLTHSYQRFMKLTGGHWLASTIHGASRSVRELRRTQHQVKANSVVQNLKSCGHLPSQLSGSASVGHRSPAKPFCVLLSLPNGRCSTPIRTFA